MAASPSNKTYSEDVIPDISLAEGGSEGNFFSKLGNFFNQNKALIPNFLQGGLGIGQTIAGIIKNNNLGDQPLYQMSDQYESVMNMYRTLSKSNLPEFEQARIDLDQSQSDTIRAASEAATSPNQILEAAVRSQINRDRGTRDLSIDNAYFRLENIDKLADAKYLMAQEEEKEFRMNKLDPWLRDKEVAEALTGSGLQNIFSSLSGTMGILNSQ